MINLKNLYISNSIEVQTKVDFFYCLEKLRAVNMIRLGININKWQKQFLGHSEHKNGKCQGRERTSQGYKSQYRPANFYPSSLSETFLPKPRSGTFPGYSHYFCMIGGLQLFTCPYSPKTVGPRGQKPRLPGLYLYCQHLALCWALRNHLKNICGRVNKNEMNT